MFAISKVIGYLVQPLTIVLILMIISFWRGRRASGKGRKTLLLALMVLAASIAGPPGNALMLPLEKSFERPALPEQVDGIIVLGGGEALSVSNVWGRLQLNSSGDRIVEFARLAHQYPTAKLVHAGGRGTAFLNVDSATNPLLQALVDLGIEEERLIFESASRNTQENVSEAKGLVKPSDGETWLLVTSAFHMPRSVGLFRKAGWKVLPWPVDYYTIGGPEFIKTGHDTAANVRTMTLALREWIALAYYLALGRIDTLFPA